MISVQLTIFDTIMTNTTMQDWGKETKGVKEPDKATNSWVVKPLLEKNVMSCVRFKVGAGILEVAALWVAVVASLLPNSTVQLCPPSWKY